MCLCGGLFSPPFFLRLLTKDFDLAQSFPLSEESHPFHIVLFQPEIPFNTGSVGRTCVALGAKLWLVRPLGFRLDDRHIKRSGMDYWEHLEWETVDNWEHLQERLPTERYWFFTKFGDSDYLNVSYQQGDVLVFGRESTGLPSSITVPAEGRRLRIETRPEARCLNLSNAVAVAAYEAVRQFRLGS